MVEGGGSDNNGSSIHAETGRRTCLYAVNCGVVGKRTKTAERNADDGDVAFLGIHMQAILTAHISTLFLIDFQKGGQRRAINSTTASGETCVVVPLR